jgi:hypothetical protein
MSESPRLIFLDQGERFVEAHKHIGRRDIGAGIFDGDLEAANGVALTRTLAELRGNRGP